MLADVLVGALCYPQIVGELLSQQSVYVLADVLVGALCYPQIVGQLLSQQSVYASRRFSWSTVLSSDSWGVAKSTKCLC